MPEMFRAVAATADGNLIMAGNTQSFGSASVNSPDFFVVKMDLSGDTIFMRSYGTSSPEDAYAVTELNDGYAIAGYALNPATGTYDMYAIKTDFNGNLLWEHYYGGTGGDYCASAVTISGNRLLFAGSTTSFTYGSYDFYLVETDSNGNQLSDAHYGGAGTDILKQVIPANDGGYLLVGNSNSFGPTTDVYAVKADSNLVLQWSQTFSSAGTDYSYDAVQDAEGNFYLLANQPGTPDSGSIKLIKTDAEGSNAITIPVASHAGDYGYGLEPAENAFLITGYTFTPMKGSEFLLIKTDLSGDTIWTQHYGGSKNEVAFSLTTADNGNIIIVGETEGFGIENVDAYVAVVDSNGMVSCPTEVSFKASDSAFCEDQAVFFTNTSVSSATFNWKLNGTVFSQEINTACFFADAGIDTVRLSACSTESAQPLKVFSKPPVQFTYSATGTTVSFFLTTTFDAASFTWDFGDGSVTNTTDIDPSHAYASEGSYWVTFSATNIEGCDSSYSLFIDVVTSIDDIELSASQLKVFPNPVHDVGTIFIGGMQHFPVKAAICDLAGRSLKQFLVQQPEEEFSFQFLKPGSYLLVLEPDSGTRSVTKLIVE